MIIFEGYFFWKNRYGLPRIEVSMWMAVIAAVLYDMSESLRKISIQSNKWVLALSGIIVSMNMTTFCNNILMEKTDTTTARNFFELLSEDDEHLYAFTMHSEPFKLELSYDFWQPAQEGDAKNVYYMGGWEFNVPIFNDMLSRYGVNNVHNDCINNDNVFVVANADAEVFQTYLQENYDENVRIYQVKDIDGAKIWRVRSKAIELDGEIVSDLSDIVSDIQIELVDGGCKIGGYVYKKNTNSFQQYAYLKVENIETGEISYVDLMLSNLAGSEDIMNGRYSAINGNIKFGDGKEYNLSIILQAENKLYEVEI